MKSQVTTKGGDAGQTSSLSGDRLPKSHVLFECVGTLDELRAHTALALRVVDDTSARDHVAVADFLNWILHVYFLMGTELSDPLSLHPEYRQGRLGPVHLARLEAEQARLEEQTPLPPKFIVAASNLAAAQVDVACTVARRLERATVRLAELYPEFDAKDILAFQNRLSDSLYILARYLENGVHLTVDYTVCATQSTESAPRDEGK